MMIKKLILLSLAFFLASVTACPADGWVDDWINQAVVTGPDNFATQKRNYASMGGMSARWPVGNDPLVSVSKPRFKAGCGGIDAYLGGFSFLEFDYLVQKLQRIMGPAAAAFAFDIALNTLCEPCSKSMKSLEAITDRLNQLQLDDCKAAKAVVTTALSPFSKTVGEQQALALADFEQSSGIKDLWHALRESATGKTISDAAAEESLSSSDLVAGCPSPLKEAFFTEAGGTYPGTLLGNLSVLRGYPQTHVDLMRGIIGDVKIEDNRPGPYIKPCADNADMDIINSIYDGSIRFKNSSLACTPASSAGITVDGISYNNYREYVHQMLENIVTRLTNKEQITDAEVNFIRSIPAYIYTGARVYVLRMNIDADPQEFADQYTDIAGKYYIYAMFRDYHKYIKDIIEYAKDIMASQKGATAASSEHTCQVNLAEPAIEHLKQMEKRVSNLAALAISEYNASLNETRNRLNVRDKLYVDYLKTRKDIAKLLGS